MSEWQPAEVQGFAAAFNADGLSPPQRLVWLAIAFHVDKEGFAEPGLDRIAAMCELSTRQVQRIVDELVRAGHLERIKNAGAKVAVRGRTNLYVVPLVDNLDIAHRAPSRRRTVMDDRTTSERRPVNVDRATSAPLTVRHPDLDRATSEPHRATSGDDRATRHPRPPATTQVEPLEPLEPQEPTARTVGKALTMRAEREADERRDQIVSRDGWIRWRVGALEAEHGPAARQYLATHAAAGPHELCAHLFASTSTPSARVPDATLSFVAGLTRSGEGWDAIVAAIDPIQLDAARSEYERVRKAMRPAS